MLEGILYKRGEPIITLNSRAAVERSVSANKSVLPLRRCPGLLAPALLYPARGSRADAGLLPGGTLF